jgi:tetratricopeptide (TPR) repeat protein
VVCGEPGRSRDRKIQSGSGQFKQLKVKENISQEKKVGVTIDDEEQLNRLTRAIEISDKYFLLLAFCNQVPRENELIARLKKRLAGHKIQVVHFDKPIENLLGELQKKLKNKKFDAVFVTGLRQSIPSNMKAKDNAFIANLNVTRDAFAKLLSGPLVLWLPEYAIGKLMNGAPDFFSVRSGIFFFESDEELIAQQISEELAGQYSDQNALRLEDREQKIRDLEELLGEYRSLPAEKHNLRIEDEIKDRLANLYYITARYQESEKLRLDLLNGAIQQRNNEEIARLCNELGLIYNAQGRYEKAIEKFEEALRIDEESRRHEHPDYATHLSNLANVYREQGRYDEAIEKYEKAMRIDEKTIGREHPNYAQSLNNLANVYLQQGRYDEAMEKYEEAMRIAEKTIGREHPDYAGHLNNLALVYGDQGRYDDAVKMHEDALGIREKTVGREHPYYAQSLNNLANVYLAEGDIKKARELFEDALRICEKTLPENHPHMLSLRKSIETSRNRLDNS